MRFLLAKILRRDGFLREESGATTIEYTMMIVAIATGLILAANALGIATSNTFQHVSDSMAITSSGDGSQGSTGSGKSDPGEDDSSKSGKRKKKR